MLDIKHRRNVGKPSFHKIPHETPVHDTLRTALSNIYRVPCKSARWFWILVRTKNRPSSIIIRYANIIHTLQYQKISYIRHYISNLTPGHFFTLAAMEIPDFSAVLLSTTNISPDNMYYCSMEPVEGFTVVIR